MRRSARVIPLILLLARSRAAAGDELVNLDLAAVDRSAVVTRTLRPDQPFVLRVTTRAPAARYCIRVERTGGAARTYEPPVPPPAFLSLEPLSGPCATLDGLVRELLRATDEKRARDLATQIAQSGDRKGCSIIESNLTVALGLLQFRLSGPYQLTGKEALKVVVERMPAKGDAPSRTWNFALEAASVPAEARWRFPNEEAWVVAEVARDIAEMALFGRGGTAPGGSDFSFDLLRSPQGPESYVVSVQLGRDEAPLEGEVTVSPHAWAPEAYSAWTRALLDRLHLKPLPPPRPPSSALVALLEPRGEVISREGRRVSDWLRVASLDPGAHERAALVLGALALREAAGVFSDTRPLLCRMTAHLSIAHTMREAAPPSRDGAYALATLDTLLGRENEALGAVARLRRPKSAPGEAAWLNALTLRNTGDWRILDKAGPASLLERLECFRALQRMQSGLRALEFLRQRAAEPVPDWGWLALEGTFTVGDEPGFSVEAGNAFAPTTLAVEIQEVNKVLGLPKGADPATELVTVLNALPGRAVGRGTGGAAALDVVGRGIWASFYQRHVLHLLRANAHHLSEMLGLKEEADTFRAEMTTRFRGLRLFPLLAESWNWQHALARPGPGATSGADQHGVCAASFDLVYRSPEIVTLFNWDSLKGLCGKARQSWIDPYLWFSAGPPTGTNYDVQHRLLGLSMLDLESIRRALDRSPHDPLLIRWYLMAGSGGKPTTEQVAAAWAPVMGYSAEAPVTKVEAMKAGDPDWIAEALRVCQADADACLDIGERLFEAGREEAGAEAHERALKHARDRVAVSNYMNWVVDYHFDRGNARRANEIADQVAQTHSAIGLRTRARLSFRMGNYEESRAWYQRLAERYPDRRDDLWAFYIRLEQRQKGGLFKTETADARAHLFPPTLERVAIETFKAPPTLTELRYTKESMPIVGTLDLWDGDIVLAVDGYRVRNLKQWYCVRGFTDDPAIHVIVWRNGRYRELTGNVRRTRFGPPQTSQSGKRPS